MCFFLLPLLQLDCAAFAHICQFIYIPFGDFAEWIEKETPNLKKFCETMKERYWSDWEQACSTLEMNTHIPKTEAEIEEAKKQQEAKQEELRKKEEAKKAKVGDLAILGVKLLR